MANSAASIVSILLTSFALTACAGSPTATVADTTTAIPGTSPSAAGAVRACSNAETAVSARSGGVAMGHVGSIIVFTNVSDHQCTLHGYPGVAGTDSTGRPLTQARRTLRGYLGGSPTEATVHIAPGGRASALVEGTDVPSGTATRCPVYPHLLVTAPDQTRSHELAGGMTGCSPLQVHPVVAGVTGRA
jgi:hypothetical protein